MLHCHHYGACGNIGACPACGGSVCPCCGRAHSPYVRPQPFIPWCPPRPIWVAPPPPPIYVHRHDPYLTGSAHAAVQRLSGRTAA